MTLVSMAPPRPFAAAGNTALGCAYLCLMALWESAGWGYGIARGALSLALLLFVIFAVRVPVGPERSTLRSLFERHLWIWALVMLMLALASIGSEFRVRMAAHAISAAVILMLWWHSMIERPGHQRTTASGLTAIAVVLCLSIPLASSVSGFVVPKLLDIATTTAAAAKAVWLGQNPYALFIDEEAVKLLRDAKFSGYKYLPAMAWAYLPFVVMFEATGILIANSLLYAGTALMVCRLSAWPRGNPWHGALMLFLASSVVATETLALGSTDIACQVPLLAAFLFWEKHPRLAGLLIGISLSMKLAPALFAATLLFPHERRRWADYLLGLTVGLLPSLVYFLWSPQPFFDNIVLFNAVRPADPSNWAYHAPPWTRSVAKTASLLMWAGLTAWTFWSRSTWWVRLRLYVITVLGVVTVAPTAHGNYAVWWAPALVVLISVLPTRPTVGLAPQQPEKSVLPA